jgi:hypothetical protein
MQKLFEYKIFRTDEPYELIFTDEFNKSINTTEVHFNVTFLPNGFAEYIYKCVYHHIYHEVNGDEEHELVLNIGEILVKLKDAGLLKNARKNVTANDIKRIEERTDKAIKEMCEGVEPVN